MHRCTEWRRYRRRSVGFVKGFELPEDRPRQTEQADDALRRQKKRALVCGPCRCRRPDQTMTLRQERTSSTDRGGYSSMFSLPTHDAQQVLTFQTDATVFCTSPGHRTKSRTFPVE